MHILFFSRICRRAAYHCIKKRKKAKIAKVHTPLRTQDTHHHPSPWGSLFESYRRADKKKTIKQPPWPLVRRYIGLLIRKCDRDHRTQPLCTCKHPKFSFIPCKQEGSINTGSDPIKHSIISSPPNRPCSQNDQGIEPLQHTSTYPVTSLLPLHKEIQIIRKRRDSLKSKTAQKPMPKLQGKHTCRRKY